MLGPLAVEQICTLHADHVVLTIGGMDIDGKCMDFNAEEAFIARTMIARARHVTVLADSPNSSAMRFSKFATLAISTGW